MRSHAQVVVIGGGVVGCSVIYHLTKLGMQDVVLIFVTVSGTINGRLLQESSVSKIYNRVMHGTHLSGIQITTASGVCAVLDLLAEGAIAQSGFVRQEDIALDQFLANRFGCNFANAENPLDSERLSADAA